MRDLVQFGNIFQFLSLCVSTVRFTFRVLTKLLCASHPDLHLHLVGTLAGRIPCVRPSRSYTCFMWGCWVGAFPVCVPLRVILASCGDAGWAHSPHFSQKSQLQDSLFSPKPLVMLNRHPPSKLHPDPLPSLSRVSL